MTKSELIQRIAEQNPHLYHRDVERIVTTIFEEIKAREARVGRNPRTGEAVPVDAKMVPFFKTGKQLRDRMNES